MSGGAGMVFDRFKSWRNSQTKGKVCPSCQHLNQEGTKVCTRCYYQIDKAAFEQKAILGDEESTDLLDELMSSMETEEARDEVMPSSFAMDDLTVEVEQYGESEDIVLNTKPDFDSMTNHEENFEEEYKLTSDDIPLYVNKFEVPETEQYIVEENKKTKIELIHPNAETAENVQVVPASQVLESNGWSGQNETSIDDPADFDGDGKVDEYEAAFANEPEKTPQAEPIPRAPSIPIPRLKAEPVVEDEKLQNSSDTVREVPSAPNLNFEERPQEEQLFSENTTFWPWLQQEEWAAPEIIKQLQSAIRSAKDQNTAQATVLLDEVGPHLGNRTSLVYSVARLLISIGREREAKKMVELAFEANPDDPDISRARDKLAS
tara:strand:+ start:4303 stop:5430 length:1128 start_codon:yes stop_codon:yes gene_type:complete